MPKSRFVITDRQAPRYAVADNIKDIATRVKDRAMSNTPHDTGTMAADWAVVQGDDPATSLVENSAPYGRYVEYGTRYMPAQAPLGRALAAERGI